MGSDQIYICLDLENLKDGGCTKSPGLTVLIGKKFLLILSLNLFVSIYAFCLYLAPCAP